MFIDNLSEDEFSAVNATQQDFQLSAMIALLPTTSNWCRIKLPHLTLAYVGEIPDLSPSLHNTLLKTALDISVNYPPLTLDVIGNAIFGTEHPVDVLLLRKTQQLLNLHAAVQEWDVSDHEFNPHVTVGPMGSLTDQTPNQITFHRILVSWGEDVVSYPLSLPPPVSTPYG